jgi:hypothetical protein
MMAEGESQAAIVRGCTGRLSIAMHLILPVVVLLLLAAPSTPLASGTVLRAVRVASAAGTTTVILEADGPLPSPTVGVLENPPRIYLDFLDVMTAPSGIRAQGSALVRRVRVAINQARPLVTRVVIDLAMAVPHRIEAGMLDRGQLQIVVGAPAAPQASPPPPHTPAPQLAAEVVPKAAPDPPAVPVARATPPPPPVSPEPAPARVRTLSPIALDPTAARAPAKDIGQYLRQASPALDRLEGLRPLLASLDAMMAPAEERLNSATEEFEAVRRTLATIDPPQTLKLTHAMLGTACVLGGVSAKARRDGAARGDAAAALSAASAAAGAIMLLDTVRAELGVVPVQKQE